MPSFSQIRKMRMGGYSMKIGFSDTHHNRAVECSRDFLLGPEAQEFSGCVVVAGQARECGKDFRLHILRSASPACRYLWLDAMQNRLWVGE